MTHYSKDGKSAYDIKSEHPECPFGWDKSAKSMTQARIDFEHVQDSIINWYEANIYKPVTATMIYGILDSPIDHHGVQAYAIDGNTGEILDQHFCSSETFAKNDL